MLFRRGFARIPQRNEEGIRRPAVSRAPSRSTDHRKGRHDRTENQNSWTISLRNSVCLRATEGRAGRQTGRGGGRARGAVSPRPHRRRRGRRLPAGVAAVRRAGPAGRGGRGGEHGTGRGARCPAEAPAEVEAAPAVAEPADAETDAEGSGPQRPIASPPPGPRVQAAPAAASAARAGRGRRSTTGSAVAEAEAETAAPPEADPVEESGDPRRRRGRSRGRKAEPEDEPRRIGTNPRKHRRKSRGKSCRRPARTRWTTCPTGMCRRGRS